MNEIKDALGRVADASAPAPLSLEHVRGRARQIRRRRTTTAVIGSAAAVAAIAGLGVALMPSTGRDGSLPPATRTPSVTPSVTPTPTEAPGADEIGPVYRVRTDVPVEQTFNDEPRVPYWFDGQIIDTDGTATPFPDRPFMFAKDGETGGWDVIRAGEAHAELVRISSAGDPITDPVPTFERGLAADPTYVAPVTLTEEDGRWVVHAPNDTFDLGRSLEYAALLGVSNQGDVYVQVDGTIKLLHAEGGAIEDVNGAAVVPGEGVTVRASDDGSWSARANDGSTRWSLDWAGVNSFSPSGKYVALVGDPKRRITGSEGWDSEHATGVIWIRDAATLAPVAAFTAPKGGYFWSWTWDGDQLLATVYVKDTGEWSLVRLSANGFTVGRATARPGGGEQPPYVFAAQ